MSSAQPHPLLKCRAFREKSLKTRKPFLKENRICYKCCSSTSHLAKDCNISAYCIECQNIDHNTALHPGPPPWTLLHSDGDTEHGGEHDVEQKDTDAVTPEITSQCTEVCKDAISGRICLLIGRDILWVLKARSQINGPHNAPYAQNLNLEWVMIGEVCFGDAHKPSSVNSMLTCTLENGRPSLFQPCRNHFFIKELPHHTFIDSPSDSHICENYQDHLLLLSQITVGDYIYSRGLLL